MIAPSPESMPMTPARICEARLTWAIYDGWSGEQCGRCSSIANIVAFGPGWFCPCAHYNVQSWSHANPPHVDPTYGPSRTAILTGHRLARQAFDEHRTAHGDYHPRDYFREGTLK